jgi:hypothetical protein
MKPCSLVVIKIRRNLMVSFSGQNNRISFTDRVVFFEYLVNILKYVSFFTPEDHILKVSAYSIHVFIARRIPF